ncbi:Sugar fermentation stimulation protein-like [Porphyridium purpureum]|uniref:Sugar fermentation stimulation protein-like n=1 Tax=Porphyridium purpureum TaxID=35688 RepID=A0A5J4YZC5_PORPP|nr:Sugar fermentation stimulation protein-like [Porphyridium purpureum]|eukprot:POR6288..scf208_2
MSKRTMKYGTSRPARSAAFLNAIPVGRAGAPRRSVCAVSRTIRGGGLEARLPESVRSTSMTLGLELGDGQPLRAGRLVKRYKRFLADVVFDDDEEQEQVTVHTANPGRMNGYSDPGTRVFCSKAKSKARKLAYTWDIAELADGARVGVNTHLANKLVELALRSAAIPSLQAYKFLKREHVVTHRKHTGRIDFLLERCASGQSEQEEQQADEQMLVEVKSVTMASEKTPGLALFPDAVSVRAKDHLELLASCVRDKKYSEAALLFCVQRSDAVAVAPAWDIDPNFCRALKAAVEQAGVQVFAVQALPERDKLVLGKMLPFYMDEPAFVAAASAAVPKRSRTRKPSTSLTAID